MRADEEAREALVQLAALLSVVSVAKCIDLRAVGSSLEHVSVLSLNHGLQPHKPGSEPLHTDPTCPDSTNPNSRPTMTMETASTD